MRNGKKLYALILAAVMMLSLCACGSVSGDSDGSQGAANSGSSSGEKIKISVGGTTADGNPMQELIYYFEEQVDALVPGVVEWVNYPNSTIGSER